MAAELITPCDAEYDLPLPIAPQTDGTELVEGQGADWHHHWHPASHPLLQTLGGRALRHSRVQLVDQQFHNQGDHAYHRFYKGPKIPTDADEQFRAVVLARAGLIPEQGIDLSGDEPRIVWLSEQQIELLRAQSTDCAFGYRNFRYDYDSIRQFMTNHVLSQKLVHTKLRDIDEFLHTRRKSVKQRLGHMLLQEQVNVSIEGVGRDYRRAYRNGMLHPYVPDEPRHLVKYTLKGKRGYRVNVFAELESRLRVGAIY